MAKLKTSSSQNRAIIPYTLDPGSDGNIMSIYFFRKLFPNAAKEQLTGNKNKSIVPKHTMKQEFHNYGFVV